MLRGALLGLTGWETAALWTYLREGEAGHDVFLGGNMGGTLGSQTISPQLRKIAKRAARYPDMISRFENSYYRKGIDRPKIVPPEVKASTLLNNLCQKRIQINRPSTVKCATALRHSSASNEPPVCALKKYTGAWPKQGGNSSIYWYCTIARQPNSLVKP